MNKRLNLNQIRKERGITLVALIITIIVLLILAVVTIAAISRDGDLISHANNAKVRYMDESENENTTVQGYLTKMPEKNGETKGETALDVTTAKTVQTVYNANTVITDSYGNKLTIPKGFKIASDSGENVTEGIVIEDVSAGDSNSVGNQFVWVPVGKIYTDTDKTDAKAKTITLSRYTFDSNTGEPTNQGDAVINSLCQETATSSLGNTTMKDINEFRTGIAENGGYYIGRYEAGDSSATSERSSSEEGTVVCKANQNVYNYITQGAAAIKCRFMYNNNDFSSDLINSYAWDTALVYIQTFGTGTDANKYSVLNKTTISTKTGENGDEYCKINDMVCNKREYTTESYNYFRRPYISRNGNRRYEENGSSSAYIGFRPILYL